MAAIAAALPAPPQNSPPNISAGKLGGAAACIVKTELLSGDGPCTSLGPFNSLLRSLSEARLPRLTLLLYSSALRLAPPPVPADAHTFPVLVSAVSDSLPHLRQLHALAFKTGFTRHVITSNSLLHGYALAAGPAVARQVFDEMPDRDPVSWNSLLKAYVNVGDLPAALEVLTQMPGAARNLVSWTTVIHGLVSGGSPETGLELFRKMQLSGLSPDSAALSAVVSACGRLGALEHAVWAAVFAARRHVPIDPPLACALIDALCKCGEPDAAVAVFSAIGTVERNAAVTVSKANPIFLFSALPSAAANVRVWTAMISGLGANGRGAEALALFEVMLAARIAANELTVTAVLSACASSGMTAEGKAIFQRLENGEFKCRVRVEHLGCMAQILARAGELDQARAMAERGGGAVAFGALATACRDQTDWQLGKEVGEILLDLDGGDSGRYIGLAAALAAAGRSAEAARVRELMSQRGIKKLPGCSVIAIGSEVHEFVAGDRRHPKAGEIYKELERMVKRLKKAGYEPGREEGVREHSEKLAMAFGLISTEPGAGLRILKNLRVCKDCHAMAKLVSKVYGRRIVMRDQARFHHFENGSCSCGDCW